MYISSVTMLLLQIQNPIKEEELISRADSAKVAFREFAEMMAADPGTALQNLGRQAIQFGLKVLAALVIYLIGAWIIRRVKHGLARLFVRKQTDRAMASFISSLVSIVLTIILIVITIGNICMDMCMIDVTDIPGVQVGDTVTIFGEDPTVGELAGILGTIPYEILTSVPRRIERIILRK